MSKCNGRRGIKRRLFPTFWMQPNAHPKEERQETVSTDCDLPGGDRNDRPKIEPIVSASEEGRLP